mmetsp:Transcript_109718/g.266783  ORF Transcript_109718/g.266783 Transcript_109718/m.266783 type:complete len:201 (+) Transcript_109718:206-808(+)
MSARVLSSRCRGFLARNWSTQSNPPSSGSATGTTTSNLPSAGTTCSATSQSAAAASRSIRQLKGNACIGGSDMFRRREVPRTLNVGKSVLPRSLSGRGCGWVSRTPLRKTLTVFAFGLPASRFSSTARTCSAPTLCETRFLVFPCTKTPSASKHTLSSPSPRKSEEPAVEKPSRTACCGCRCWACCCAGRCSPSITASNM